MRFTTTLLLAVISTGSGASSIIERGIPQIAYLPDRPYCGNEPRPPIRFFDGDDGRSIPKSMWPMRRA